MQDRVPLYPGRVKLTPVSGQENTYDMVRSDEPTQEGDPLSKATFLKDATATLFGLDATAVPDDVFGLLSRFQKGLGNEYVWGRSKSESFEVLDNTSNPYGRFTIYSDSHATGSPKMSSLMYYKTAELVDGDIVLGDQFTPTSQPITANQSYWNGLFPFYVQFGEYILYLVSIYDTTTGYISFNGYYTVIGQKTIIKQYGYVNSPDPNAYPPAVSDGYTYTALGQFGAIGKPEIGTYVGTGNSACSIVYEKPPKFVAIFSKRTINGSDYIPFGFYAPELGSGFITYPQSSQNSYCYLDSCYLRDNAFKTSNNYMDISGRTYQYIFWS